MRVLRYWLARTYARLEAMKLLNWRMAAAVANDTLTPADSSSVKVYGTETLVDVYRTLLEKQLIVVVTPPKAQAPAEPVPVAAARLQILKRVEAAVTGLDERVARIRAAASLGELTQRSHETAIAIQQAQGRPAAEEFWAHVRAILLHWQGREAGARA